MRRLAFTMVELIFVIVIIGILSAVVAPRLQSNNLQEATDQIISHIRYTQHLALNEDMYLPDAQLSNKYTIALQQAKQTRQWFKQMWQIEFHQSTVGLPYSIYSDHPSDGGSNEFDYSPDWSNTASGSDVIARDPQTGLYLIKDNASNAVPANTRFTDVDISSKYGIGINMDTCDAFAGSSSMNRIYFDNMGRPYCGLAADSPELNPYTRLANDTIKIRLTQTNPTATQIICVEPYSGYVHECI